jgi:Uma2 family endonuclease
MATTATVTVEEYLSSPQYKHCEYLDGVIQDKYPVVDGVPLVNNVHGALLLLIGELFGNDKKDWRVKCGTEVTTVINPTRFRLPDVSVIPFGPMDEYQITPPLIAIEVLSPSNSGKDLLAKLEDYAQFSIENVWVIDHATRTGKTCKGAEMTETSRFAVPGTAIYLDVPQLFAQFDEENQPLAD